jgi:hypothetical protein
MYLPLLLALLPPLLQQLLRPHAEHERVLNQEREGRKDRFSVVVHTSLDSGAAGRMCVHDFGRTSDLDSCSRAVGSWPPQQHTDTTTTGCADATTVCVCVCVCVRACVRAVCVCVCVVCVCACVCALARVLTLRNLSIASCTRSLAGFRFSRRVGDVTLGFSSSSSSSATAVDAGGGRRHGLAAPLADARLAVGVDDSDRDSTAASDGRSAAAHRTCSVAVTHRPPTPPPTTPADAQPPARALSATA